MELAINVFADSTTSGPRRRLVRVHVRDSRYPDLRGIFTYEVSYLPAPAGHDPDGPLEPDMLLGAQMHGIAVEWAPGASWVKGRPFLSVAFMRDLPMSTWEVAGRERLGMALSSDVGKQVLRTVPAEPVEIVVDTPTPDLGVIDDAAAQMVTKVHGHIDTTTPAGRRRFQSLLKQARAAVLYQQLLGAGRMDPAAEIAKAYNVSPAAARTWIHRARQSGFLGKAIGRTAGQQRTDSVT